MHLLFKKQFETPKEVIDRYIATGQLPVGHAYTYAGRLDPLATGILPVLDETTLQLREEILALPKVYEIEVLFGVSTDSFDLLGIPYVEQVVSTWHTLQPQSHTIPLVKGEYTKGKEPEALREYLSTIDFKSLQGKYVQTYPFFSSKPIDGVPLFAYTKMHGIEKTNAIAPKKEVDLYEAAFTGTYLMQKEDVLHRVKDIVTHIKGDFRQEEVLRHWNNFKDMQDRFVVGTFTLKVSSGFYVRSFACWLGQMLGVGALALSIKRIQLGKYTLTDCLK